eukprot:1440728-Prorocentrum_lima.AAC.1
MTSSLVGSEMCIRDSFDNLHALYLGIFRDAAGSFIAELLAEGVPGAGAVSYTHLTLPTICSV